MILAPYGLQAYLTGHVFKDNDQSVQKFLADWKKIYPLNTKNSKENGSLHMSSPFNSLNDDKKLSDEDYLSKVVEIIIGDCKMKYPFCYVFITEVDRKMYQLRPQKTDPACKSFNPQETLAQLNKQSVEALENCQLMVSYNQQQPSDSFCLKSSTNQAIKQCDSLFLEKVNSTREDGSNDFASSMINGDLLLKKSCNCMKCQQSNLKKQLKSGNGSNGLPSSFNQFSSKSKDRSFEKERGKHLKNCPPFHKRAELSLKPDEEFIISSSSSLMQSQTSSSSPVNSNVNMSSSSLNQSSATPIIMSYKSPVSTSTSSILNTPGIESSPLSNFNCDAVEHTSPITSKEESASINTPTTISSQLNQSPKDKSGLSSTLSPNVNHNSLSNTTDNLNGNSKSGDHSSMPNTDSGVKSEASMATSQLCSLGEMSGEKGTFPMKRPFLFKNVYEGDHDLRHGLLYDFSSESDQSWQLPLPKNRRTNDNSLMNDFMLDLNCRDYADYSIHELPHFRNRDSYEFKEIEGMGVATSKQHFDPSIETMTVTERSLSEMINGTMEQQQHSLGGNNNGKLMKSKESNDLSSYNKTNAKSAFSRNDDDFANTYSDLEYLNSSGDESNDNFQAPLTPKNSNGPSNVPHIPDSDSYVSNSINELSRMFPTPPSLEAMQASPGNNNNSHTLSNDSKNDRAAGEGAQEQADKKEVDEEVKVSFIFNLDFIFIFYIFLGLFFCVQASDAIVFCYLKKLRSFGEC